MNSPQARRPKRDAAFRRELAAARRHGDLCFAGLLSEEWINTALGEARSSWQGWIFTPAVTVWVSSRSDSEPKSWSSSPRSNHLDLILFALGSHGGKDLYALATLKQFCPQVPILVLIDNEVEGQERVAREAGAQVVVAKTASRNEIIQALREMRSKSLLHHYADFSGQEVNEKTSHP